MISIKGKFFGEKNIRTVEVDEKRLYGAKVTGNIIVIGVLGTQDLRVEFSNQKETDEAIKILGINVQGAKGK